MFPFHTHGKHHKTRIRSSIRYSIQRLPISSHFFLFYAPWKHKKEGLLRGSQMEKMVKNELAKANSSSFVALTGGRAVAA